MPWWISSQEENTDKQVSGIAAGQMETKKYRSRIKAWAIFFWCIDTSIADTLTPMWRFVSPCECSGFQPFTRQHPENQGKLSALWTHEQDSEEISPVSPCVRSGYVPPFVTPFVTPSSGCIHQNRHQTRCLHYIRDVVLTSPGLFFTTLRLGKNSPGLVEAIWLLLRAYLKKTSQTVQVNDTIFATSLSEPYFCTTNPTH